MKQVKSKRLRYHVLREIIEQRGFTKGVELGVKEGETFHYLLSKCPDLVLTGVDIFEMQPDNVVQDYRGWNQSRNEARVCKIVEKFPVRADLLKMDSAKSAELFEKGSVDFVFIDADHSAMSVYKDIMAWYDRISSKGAMFGHDYNWPSVRYVVDNIFENVMRYDDNVWEGEFIVQWKPDPERVEEVDRATGHWQRNRRMLKGGNPLHRPIRLKLGPYGEKAKS